MDDSLVRITREMRRPAAETELGRPQQVDFSDAGLIHAAGDAVTNDDIQAVMPNGSLLVYLGSTLHGGGANRSDRSRMSLVNIPALGWLGQVEEEQMCVPREAAASHPKRMRELMEYPSHGPLLGTCSRVFEH